MIEELTPSDVADRLASDDPPQLIDVREDWEVETARLGDAIHIPMNEIPMRHHELPADRELITFCHHGARSATVANWLTHNGHERVANLHGGIDAWARDVDQSIPRY